MHAWRLVAIATLIICSCSTQPLLSKETEGLIEYGQANTLRQTDPVKACETYLSLADKKEFILTDVAYVRSLQTCDLKTHVLNWDRSVPSWLEKEKNLIVYKALSNPIEKALFVQKNTSLFQTPERVQIYQDAISDPKISETDKKVLQDSLFSLAPRFMPEQQDKDLFKIIKDYRSVRDFAKAKNLLNKILTSTHFSNDEKFQAHKELFATLKLQKNQNQQAYLKQTKTWAEFIKLDSKSPALKINQFYEAQFNYIRVTWTEQGADQALQLLDALQNKIQGKKSLFEIFWLRARIFEEKKAYDQAISQLELALKETIPLWKDKEKILWSLAWTCYKNSKFEEATANLTTLIENTDTSAYSRFKYLYWKGAALQKQKQTDGAESLWKQIAEEDVFGYYNLLSHLQLKLPLRNYDLTPYSPKKLLSDRNELIFSALQKVKENDLASRLLTMETVNLADIKKDSVEDITSLFYYHALIGNYKFVFQVFNSLPYEQQRDIFLKIPRQLFPQPYAEQLYDVASQSQVEAELIYSIMRQESSFDPRARSPMDAFGLLQILPEVAKKIARDNGIPFNSFEDLYDEKTNISLGAQLLKKQIASFKNRFILYVASYNASSSAVRKWHERYTGDDLMFIEDIPYEETKAYVKLVMRNLIIYKKLKNRDGLQQFPKELLDLSSPTPVTDPALPPAPSN